MIRLIYRIGSILLYIITANPIYIWQSDKCIPPSSNTHILMVKTAYAARTGYAVAFTEDLSKSAVGYIVNDRYMMSAFPAMLMVGLVGGRLCHAV